MSGGTRTVNRPSSVIVAFASTALTCPASTDPLYHLRLAVRARGAGRVRRYQHRLSVRRLADRKRLEFSALDTLGRVAWRLLELSERFGHQTDDGIAVELPLSQEQLASWCGASREATVKALGTLRSLGTITTARRRVLIGDPEALRRHARGLAGG